jgi:type IX secretion system PorP/SprF family membrane protein
MKLSFFHRLFVAGLIPVTGALAQADISLASHWINRANYNPASIARTNYIYFFSSACQQWVGVDGAPKIFNVQASGYIHNLRSAFGLSFVSDKIGVTQMFNPMLNYAYRIDNNKDWALSLGLSAGLFMRSINGTLFEAETMSDPAIHYNTEQITRPDANIGLEYQNSYFIFGVSSTHLFSIGSKNNQFLNTNHRYGYAIYKNNNLALFYYKIGLQVVNRSNLTILEGNVFIHFKHATGLMKGPREIFDLGLTYRTSRQIILLFGLLLSPDLRVGYAYDHSFISAFSQNGTHEIMIEYRIFSKAASTRFICVSKQK